MTKTLKIAIILIIYIYFLRNKFVSQLCGEERMELSVWLDSISSAVEQLMDELRA